MRLFEFDEQGSTDGTDGSDQIETPMSSNVESLLVRLDASNVKQLKLDQFIDELNNMSNVEINKDNEDEVNNVKQIIAKTGKADINGEYIVMDYSAPKSPEETDTQKIAMKNVKDNVS